MATGRTHKKWSRIYMDGYDVSGYVRSWGSIVNDHDLVGEPAVGDALHGFLPGHANNSIGPISSIMDNTTNGFFDKFKAAGEIVVVSVPIGIRAAPASGDVVGSGDLELFSFVTSADTGSIAITSDLGGSVRATSLLYPNPWGNVMHAKGAETGVNSSTADHDHAAQTTFGGYMVYHLFTSNGTITLKVQDSSTDIDGNFGDLLSSGVIDASVTPAALPVYLASNATVERYTRWQLVLGTATTATFFISFHRGNTI